MARYALLCFVVLAVGLVGGAMAGPVVNGTEHEHDRQSIETATAMADVPCPLEQRVESRTGTDSTPGESNPNRTDRHAPEPRIVELYPNPTTHGNAGEYLVLDVPSATDLASLENWTITDGHTSATLPNATVSGRVALSADPETSRSLTDDPVRELEGTLRLAVDGDELELRNGTETVDRVSYVEAPLAERWYRHDPDSAASESSSGNAVAGDWWPRDATCVPVSSADVDEATTFVLPDSPAVARETIRNADDRVLLAGYTVTSEAIARDLVAAAERGVDVAVLLEASPVGGTPAATESVLETLAEGGVDVRTIGGEGGRYRYHHPKYAVADDRVVVTSENWKPSGVGGEGSRGWGVRLENATLAADLAAVFRADFEGWDTQSGAAYRRNASFVEDDGDGDDTAPEYPTEHEPATIPLESAELLVAPDNAEPRLAELLATADEEILVKQASLDTDAAVLEPVLEAARRGVDVEILLDSAWYHEDENAAIAEELEATAAREELPLEVRLVEETDRFSKIHAKGVVIDREVAVVGSANWNDNAFENNREVLVALHGEAAADYYASVFEADWQGDTWSLPIGFAIVVVVALIGAAIVGARYVRFGEA